MPRVGFESTIPVPESVKPRGHCDRLLDNYADKIKCPCNRRNNGNLLVNGKLRLALQYTGIRLCS
jgi:hypothetical protein